MTDVARGVAENDGEHAAHEMLSGGAGRFRWVAAVILGVLGHFLNLLPVALSPGTDLIFGGVAYLLAAVTLGPGPGLVTAALASLRTLWLWNHPFALLIFSAEALLVGMLSQRLRYRPLIADLLFWLFAGVPLLFLTYHFVLGVSGTTATVIFLKQPLNGLIDALLVEMLLLFPVLRRWLRLPGAPRLRSALAVVVSTAALLPALVFGIWMGRREWARNVERAHELVVLGAQAHASKLEQYVLLHERSVRSVAESAERRGDFHAEAVQRLVSAEHEQFPGFVNMYAADASGRTIAFHPMTNEQGESLIGLNFSDRSYFQEARRTHQTVLTDVFEGRGGVNEPLVVIAHPVILSDTFAGIVLGALDLEALPPPSLTSTYTDRLRVVDSVGTLVFDSDRAYQPGQKPRTLMDSVAFSRIREAGHGHTTVYATRPEAAAPMVMASQVLAGVATIPSLGWWVWVEQPFAEIQELSSESYARLFSLLITVMLVALLVSIVLAAYLAQPLLRLRAAAGALAGGDLRARVGTLPPIVPVEIVEMGRGFDEMAAALADRTEELEELGEIGRSLTSTLELQELLRRITAAAVRLVEPDGCGIALLQDGGEVLHAAESNVGLLAPSAGQNIPMDASLIGWVTRSGRSVLSVDVSDDSRVHQSYIDTSTIRSVICAPLVGRSGPLGALIAVRGRDNPHPFLESDLQLLERLAGSAAVAVENARLLEAAKAASLAKSDFIATVSHELRTPLNAVLGHLDLLDFGVHGDLNSAQRQALKRIHTATRHLRGLIEEVLSFSQLEAGRVEVRWTEVDLCAILREVATVIEPLAAEKGLRFDARCDDPERLLIQSDADKIRQILINLAGNAVKFTDQGSIRIDAELHDGAARISVRDTGIGIASEDQARLFRPFEQLESGLSRPHGGTGLGLYLSSQYARLLGGSLGVSSQPAQGSEFTLVLPLEAPRDIQEESRQAVESQR